MAKEERDLAKRAEEQGFEVRRTSKGHYMVTKDGERITTISGTSSDPRALKNAKAQLKRAGFVDK